MVSTDSQARIGLIIPSSNRLAEPQFNRYAPPDVTVHATRIRMTGKWHKPLGELQRPLEEAAAALSDVKPDVIVFHCTANSMENGLAGEADIVETVQSATSCAAITVAQAIVQALRRLGVKKLVLVSPYVKKTNEHESRYLLASGFEVIHDVGLGLTSEGYSAVTPEEWIRVVSENARPEADGYFLSCTNTRMIEAIRELEQRLDRPIVSSNQAALWACLKKLGVHHTDERLGRLFRDV
ncbi:MAG TPA: hypothetical protein VNO43_15840 [Candidatus Eisenbacteria bacterium]|nr:hypothetical protein [Candidatus Eisenbacteria bacterium]